MEGYAEDFLDLVSGHQARLKDQSAPRQRHPGRHSKRGGKVCHKAIFDLQCTRQEAAFSIVSGVIIWSHLPLLVELYTVIAVF